MKNRTSSPHGHRDFRFGRFRSGYRFLWFLALHWSLALQSGAEPVADEEVQPAAYGRFVPERSDDFAWENDRVAFRVYGPALKSSAENSGIDCWAKRVSYPIIDKWYRLNEEQNQSYHKDHGEGADFYHVGKSRGCGGTAIWHDGKMVLSNVYTDWEILENGPERCVFRLSYEYRIKNQAILEKKTISIELGQRLFRSESVFTIDGKPADLEIAIGLSTQNQKGEATLNPDEGWMAVWEDLKGGFGTGVVTDPAAIVKAEEIRSDKRDESHALLIVNTDEEGKTIHWAGFAWAKASEIQSAAQWTQFLEKFAEEHL